MYTCQKVAGEDEITYHSSVTIPYIFNVIQYRSYVVQFLVSLKAFLKPLVITL